MLARSYVAALAGAPAAIVRVLAAGVLLAPAVDLGPVLARDADELADDLRRQLGADVVDEVDLDVARDVVEDGCGRSSRILGSRSPMTRALKCGARLRR